MKPLVEHQKARKREFTWSRRKNGFSDQPIFRLAATRCNMPLYQLLAFVNRLEEHANNAANKGLIRGSLALFDADEFGMALGMTGEDAARIYAALEDPKIGWIAEGHIVDFVDRNADREEDVDDTRQRKRRQRTRERIMQQLAKLARLGKIEPPERLSIEVSLRGLNDQQLWDVQERLTRAELSTGHNVTLRDIVTVTPEQTKIREEIAVTAVDNSGGGAGGESGGLAKEGVGEAAEAASRWVEKDCVRLVVERLVIHTNQAVTLVERWRRDLQDDAALQGIVVEASGRAHSGAAFQALVAGAVEREVKVRRDGRQLGLMPPRPGAAKGPETALGHVVTPVAVDNLKREAS